MPQLKHCLFRESSLTLPSCYPETFTLFGVFHFYFPLSPPLSLNWLLPTSLVFVHLRGHSGASQVTLVVKNPPVNAEDIRDVG